MITQEDIDAFKPDFERVEEAIRRAEKGRNYA